MKKVMKRLSLKKETVALLRSKEMKQIAGGAATLVCIETVNLCVETEWTCYTGPPMDCIEP